MLRLVATSSVPRLSSRGTALAARRCSGAAPDERSLFERLRDSIRTPRAGVRTGRRLVGTDDRGNRYFVIPATVRTHGGAAAGEVREVVFPDDYDTAEYHPSHVPVEWQQWLSKQALEPPSAAALEAPSASLEPAGEQQQPAVRDREAALAEERAILAGKRAREMRDSWQRGAVTSRRGARELTGEMVSVAARLTGPSLTDIRRESSRMISNAFARRTCVKFICARGRPA
ncbi:hypothetical protein EMIHUDRAFT_210289 [Emiliania huxleyi CCMP1516]|uniref:NADH dehydrogenase [ubiquinone] 1 alpha subcomplex subunit 12 n=2 Tax=Emiliania huxleyi TaxID=2903 RepID=A0A0D3IZT0_EMIH1|nr:hypothetical protein EMIHUDRAFT_210289 [Emiliania huxleyi CCMP1516]EOD16765.1 hypothetical protein EMIHUDRAFT_210289 [Emiliania huxleyi CCMP1516]|eukprot:XP_005769194.1 hypothetical protein EMIHUDRAFT_210289 [Emiliania huxleyi CCMP1516]